MFHGSATVARRRAHVEQSLPDTAVEQKANVISLPGGGEDIDPSTPVVIVQTFPCRFRGASEQEKLRADQVGARIDGAVLCPAGTDVDPKNTLVISGEMEVSGGGRLPWTRTMSIVAVPPFESDETEREILVADAGG